MAFENCKWLMPGWSYHGGDTQFVSSFESLGDELRGVIWKGLTKMQRGMILGVTEDV